jgi:hypothetical protein
MAIETTYTRAPSALATRLAAGADVFILTAISGRPMGFARCQK